jgi:hypothetical protein
MPKVEKSAPEANSQPNQGMPAGAAKASHIVPSSKTHGEASAVSNSDACTPSNQHVASKISSSCVEDFHLALQLKTANRLGDAGQRHFHALLQALSQHLHTKSQCVVQKPCCENWLAHYLLLKESRFKQPHGPFFVS